MSLRVILIFYFGLVGVLKKKLQKKTRKLGFLGISGSHVAAWDALLQ